MAKQVMQNIGGTSVFEFIEAFPDETACLKHIFDVRFGPQYLCPQCKRSTKWYRIRSQRSFASNCCGGQNLQPTSGTIFHRSKTPLQLWLYAMLHFSNSRRGVTTHFLVRHLGLSQKAAWRTADRIRMQMAAIDRDRIVGGPGEPVYVGETLLRGVRTKGLRGKGRAILLGLADEASAIAFHVVDRSRPSLLAHVKSRIHAQSVLVCQDAATYRHLTDYGHKTALLRHFQQVLIRGPNEKDGPLEGYWLNLKRTIRSTHLHIERSNVWKYLREFEFRYNRRHYPESTFWDLVARFPPLAKDGDESIARAIARPA